MHTVTYVVLYRKCSARPDHITIRLRYESDRTGRILLYDTRACPSFTGILGFYIPMTT